MSGRSDARITERDLSPETWLSAENFGDLMALAGENLVKANEVLGDGYTIVEQAALVGKEFAVTSYKAIPGSHRNGDGEARNYASVTCILSTPISVDGTLVNKVRFNDGGTGILDALNKAYEGRAFSPMYVRKGLKASVYENPYGDGFSTTYYFDTSA